MNETFIAVIFQLIIQCYSSQFSVLKRLNAEQQAKNQLQQFSKFLHALGTQSNLVQLSITRLVKKLKIKAVAAIQCYL